MSHDITGKTIGYSTNEFPTIAPDQIKDTDLLFGQHQNGNANFRIYDIVSKVMEGIDIDPGQDPGYDPGGELGEQVTYSVIIDHSKSDPGKMCTYADDAIAFNRKNGWDNVKDKPIFKKIRPCVLKDGEVLYYLNPDNYNYKYNVDTGITYSQIQEALQTKAWYTKGKYVAYQTSTSQAVFTMSTCNYRYRLDASPIDGNDFPDYPTNTDFTDANYTRAALVSIEGQYISYDATKRISWRFCVYNETTGVIAFPESPTTPLTYNGANVQYGFAYAGCVEGTEYARPSYSTAQKVLWKHFETNMPMFNVTSQDDVTTPGTPVNDWLVHGNLHDTINVIGYGNAGSQAEAADISTLGNDVMVEFGERMGYKFEWLDENRLKVSVTNRPNAAGYWYDAFSYSGYNDCDKIYIGAYKGYVSNGLLYSSSGTTPTRNQTIATFRNYARAKGNGYEQRWFGSVTLTQALYLIAYCNLDSQSIVGQGYVGGSSAHQTGATNTYGMCNQNSSNKGSTTTGIKCLGLEDFWGNIREWVEGYQSDASRNILLYNFGSTPEWANYGNGGVTENLGNYISKVRGGRLGFTPVEVVGSGSTKYCDFARIEPSCCGLFGGNYSAATGAGNFQISLDSTVYASNSAIGARLMYFHRG